MNQTPAVRRALKLFVVLSRASVALDRHASDDVTRHGLTLTEFAILEALYHGGPMLLGEVQRKILVSSGGITYLVDRLEEKGFTERRECPGDRRARFAALTPKGEALIARIFPGHATRLTAAMAGLTAAEQEEAIRLLKKLGIGADERFTPSDK
jgi:MarR family transcriptional regulator, 2-MHQ and catechol-resistance regulon repressor